MPKLFDTEDNEKPNTLDAETADTTAVTPQVGDAPQMNELERQQTENIGPQSAAVAHSLKSQARIFDRLVAGLSSQ